MAAMFRGLVACVAIAFGFWVASAQAGKEDDTLTIAWHESIDTLDAYFNMNPEGIMLAREVWDTLVQRDPDTFEIKPSLATSWQWVDDLTLDLELRKGVEFHDGQPFDADDVIYTITTMRDPATKVLNPSVLSWIKDIEKLDQYKVRIHLNAPFPAALEYLAGPIPIYPHVYYSKVGSKGMSRMPIGTGPYKVAKVEAGKEIILEKSDGKGPRGSANIGHLVIRFIPQKTTQIAELLAGKLDWVYYLPPDQVKFVERVPTLQVVGGETMRITYLYFDSAGRSGQSPLQNLKVRQAIAHAVNREEISKVIFGGAANVPKSPCFVSQFGCYQGAPQYDFNIEKAKQLMAEAGFASGFDTEMVSYSPAQVNDAVAGYLRAIGVRARVVGLQYPTFEKRVLEGSIPLVLGAWASYRINDSAAMVGMMFNGSGEDYARDPDVQKWLKEADTSSDKSVRMADYQKSIERITDQMYFLPLSTTNIYYAFRKGLTFKTYTDEIPRYYLYKWN